MNREIHRVLRVWYYPGFLSITAMAPYLAVVPVPVSLTTFLIYR